MRLFALPRLAVRLHTNEFDLSTHSLQSKVTRKIVKSRYSCQGTMRQPTRPPTALPIALVIMLLGMSASLTIDSGDRAELADDKPALETHSNQFFPGSQAGSVYSASSVQASYYHTCAKLDNSSMKCWGQGSFGKLGTGNTLSQNQPWPVLLGWQGGVNTAAEVGQGSGSSGHHNCAMMTDGTIQCWGEDFLGQIGHGGSSGWHNYPTDATMPLYQTAVQVSNGGHHSCAIMEDTNTADHSLYCWGHNGEGQLGIETSSGAQPPELTVPTHVELPAGRSPIAISLGWVISCAILDDGSGMCWGNNDYGQLGVGSVGGNRTLPTPISILPQNRTLAAIAPGNAHTCAILDNGSVGCWGLNHIGQFGDGTQTGSHTYLKYTSLPPGRTAISIDV